MGSFPRERPPAREAVELRDGDAKRFGGKGVRKAVENVRAKIAGAITGMEATDQGLIDQAMIKLDGASEMWDNGKYVFFKSKAPSLTPEQMVAHWVDWVSKYPILLLEDGMAENDWSGWKALTQELGTKIELVGDDLFCTNPQILRKGIDQGVATVATGAGHLKTGSGCRSERIAKYNQLIRIEDELGTQAKFAGKAAFKNASSR